MKIREWFYVVAIMAFLLVLIMLTDCLLVKPYYQRLSPYEYDKVMGWMPKQDFTRNFRQRDAAGNRYNASFSTDKHRFRIYGNPATAKTKILFLGDSFTGDPFTGNNEMYFSVVKSVLSEKYNKDVEIFAVGGGGYGTLQEYLLLKNQIKVIKPDIFVLQFSDNDFQNNLFAWESRGIVRNQYLFRPYYGINAGEIYHSSDLVTSSYKFFYKYSLLFERADTIVQKLQYKYYGDYLKKLSPQELEKLEGDSYVVTKKLLLLLKNEFSENAKLFIMVDMTDDKHLNELQVKLAKEAGFTPLLFPVQNLNKYEAEHKGVVLRHADGGHLNIQGNKILGEGLAAELFGYINRQQ